MQETYRPRHIKYSICCPIPGGGGGTPSLVGGYPHPDLTKGGTLSLDGEGKPHLDLAGGGYPIPGQGRYPHHGVLSLSWPGTSHSGTPWKRHGTSGSIMGCRRRWGTTPPPPPSGCEHWKHNLLERRYFTGDSLSVVTLLWKDALRNCRLRSL